MIVCDSKSIGVSTVFHFPPSNSKCHRKNNVEKHLQTLDYQYISSVWFVTRSFNMPHEIKVRLLLLRILNFWHHARIHLSICDTVSYYWLCIVKCSGFGVSIFLFLSTKYGISNGCAYYVQTLFSRNWWWLSWWFKSL